MTELGNAKRQCVVATLILFGWEPHRAHGVHWYALIRKTTLVEVISCTYVGGTVTGGQYSQFGIDMNYGWLPCPWEDMPGAAIMSLYERQVSL